MRGDSCAILMRHGLVTYTPYELEDTVSLIELVVLLVFCIADTYTHDAVLDAFGRSVMAILSKRKTSRLKSKQLAYHTWHNMVHSSDLLFREVRAEINIQIK